MTSPPNHRVEGANHFGITVSDIETSLAFFVGILGFEEGPTVDLDETFSAGVTGIDGALIRVTFVEGPGVTVELLQYLAPAGRSATPTRPCDVGSAHLAFFVVGIEAIVAAAAGAGWSLAGAIQPIVSGPRAGGRAAYIRDTDGITLELVERP